MKKLPVLKSAFTFIEVIVVIAVLAVVLPAIFSIVFVIVKQQAKIYKLSEVKRQGDFAVSSMTSLIRNYAAELYSDALVNKTCDTAGSSDTLPYFQDKYNSASYFHYVLSNNAIASNSSVANVSGNLTNANVRIEQLNGEEIVQCTKSNAYSNPVILIQFKICYNDGSPSCSAVPAVDSASLDYTTQVSMRVF